MKTAKKAAKRGTHVSNTGDTDDAEDVESEESNGDGVKVRKLKVFNTMSSSVRFIKS